MDKKNLLSKGVVLGVLVLFIGTCILPVDMSKIAGGNTTHATAEYDIEVDDDADPGWYDSIHVHTIQEGIDNASDGYTVYVHLGIYKENVVINKSITLVGEDKDTTVINGILRSHVVKIKANWVNITGFTIKNSKTSGTQKQWSGVYAYNSREHCTISDNTFINNDCGISIRITSNHNTISDNTITDILYYGIRVDSFSEGNTIINNTVTESDECGIKIGTLNIESNNNTIAGNTFEYNEVGIGLEASNDNLIYDNHVEDNEIGIELTDSCKNNFIYHNFCDNINNACDDGINIWNDSYPSGGNYWGDYNGTDNFSGPHQNMPGSDDVGDSPYNISGGSNKDWYPLMIPDETSPIVKILKPENAELYINNKKIIPLFVTLIIGSIDIEVKAVDRHSGIDRVEFYIDGELKANFTSMPYNWTWDERTLFKFRHTINVTAYDCSINKNFNSKEITVWKFL